MATDVEPFSRARLVTLELSNQLSANLKCLTFYYHAFGYDIGTLHVLDQNDHIVWSLPQASGIQQIPLFLKLQSIINACFLSDFSCMRNVIKSTAECYVHIFVP